MGRGRRCVMAYNVDFLLSALIFLLIILRHFMEQRALNTKSSKAFLTFLLLGIANIVLDLLCTVFITLARPELAWMSECCLTVLYPLGLTALFLIRVCYLMSGTYNPFIYFNF